MAEAAVAVSIAKDLVQIGDQIEKWAEKLYSSKLINFGGGQARDEFTQSTVKHFRTLFPDYNCLVIDNVWKHIVSLENFKHHHVEIPRDLFGTHGFDIYVFESGLVTKGGDGGFINWCFGGKYIRNGNQVKFISMKKK